MHGPVLLGLLVLAAVVPRELLALNPARTVFQYNCQTWRRQNGLVASDVNSIAQTSDGYIWLGTSRGPVRFDGIDFKLMDMNGLPEVRSTVVISIAPSIRGGFHFGLERGGVGYCDGKQVSLPGNDAWSGLNLTVHSVLETPEGDLWLAAESLAGRLHGNDFEQVLTSDQDTRNYDSTALFRDSEGRVWIGTAAGGLYYWSMGTLTKFPDPKLDSLTIRSFAQDKEGNIWVGTDSGVLCYDTNFQKLDWQFPWYATRALLADREGSLWFGTVGGGLLRYQRGELTQFRRTDGLADDIVLSLAEDEEGSLWVGTRNGLSQFSDVTMPTLGKTEGLTAELNVSVCSSQRGGFWIATSEGFTYYDGTAQNFTNGLEEPYIDSIYEARNGDIYLINGRRDVQVVSGGRVVASHPNSNWPANLAEDDRSVLVSLGKELYRVGTNFYEPYVFADGQAPPFNWIFSLNASRDGSIWVGSDEGICRLRDGSFEFWPSTNGLGGSNVRWVCEDSDGIVWAGLEVGIGRLKDGVASVINTDDGLFDNIINAIVPDDHGNLWVDSSRGLFSVSRRSLNEFADGRSAGVQCVAYDGMDSVKGWEKFQQGGSGCKTLDGRVWFPTSQGIVMIDPTNIERSATSSRIQIQEVRANGSALGTAGPAIVAPGKGDLEVHYAGLSYIAPLKTLYRYRLVGYDTEWVEAGNRRAAFYTNLKPGRYEFQVQARNGREGWTDQHAGFEVELRPHFFETNWFRAALLLAGAGLVVGGYLWWSRRLRWKQRQLRRARDLLEKRVEERTAELKSEIEERKRIQEEVELVHRQLVDASRQAGQAEVASSVLHNVGNVLNSVNVSTSLVTDRLRSLRLRNIGKAAEMLEAHRNNLSEFLAHDPKGREIPNYLIQFSGYLSREQSVLLNELKDLAENVDHIKEIVAMQQNYAKVSGVVERTAISSLVESALRMHAGAYVRHGVGIVREYRDVPEVVVDKHKVLQILVNVIHNAKYACDAGDNPDKQVRVRIERDGADSVRIEIQDNGVGIAPENLTRVFSHGYTTRKNGHGFGLHSAALAARELGGKLTAASNGIGHGATFTLVLPLVARESRCISDRRANLPCGSGHSERTEEVAAA